MSMLKLHKLVGLAALGCALALTPLPASADILGGAVNVNPQVSGCGVFVLDLNGAAAGTDLVFTLPASAAVRPLSVLFNAECSVASADSATWLDLNIQLLNAAGALIAVLQPSNSDNALCTSSGSNVLDNWVSASTNTYSLFGAGAAVPGLRIRATASLANCAAGEQFRIDDTSTIVMR
jgi:hypothetical protein